MIQHTLFSPDARSEDDRLLDSILPLAHKWLDASVPERERIHNTLQAIALDFLDGFFVPLTAQSSRTHRLSNALTPPSASNMSTSRASRWPAPPISPPRCQPLCCRRPPRQRSLPTSTKTQSPADTPTNALMLATKIHSEFDRLRYYIDRVPGSAHTNEFKRTRDAVPLLPGLYPASGCVMLRNNEPERTQLADLPCPRLLRLHAACCKMMEMAGAAGYVETVLDDMERL